MASMNAMSLGAVRLRFMRAASVHHGNNRLGIGIIEVAEESIGIASDQAEGRESLGWEMLQIEGQNGACPAFDRGREDVTVIVIGKRQAGSPVFIAADIRVRQNSLHDVARAKQTLACFSSGSQLDFPHFMRRGKESPRVVSASLREFPRCRRHAGRRKYRSATKAPPVRRRWRR